MNHSRCVCQRYVLQHDTPEIRLGAVVEYDNDKDRYFVVNLEDVSRYPLTDRSYFSFHANVVEGSKYWFRKENN
ncbi:MAG: hypothetical protein WD512_06245 [Candidatus Paceibacterota bacterium]